MNDLSKLRSVSLAYIRFKAAHDPLIHEPWQDPHSRCGLTRSGICVAKISEACVYPRCSPHRKENHYDKT